MPEPDGEPLVLGSGHVVFPAAIEAHYRRSPFIKELCVVGLPSGAGGTAAALYAVVVPDRDVLLARRMVNAGEIVRFEMEGLGVGLEEHERVAAYQVSMEPLPRTSAGALKRDDVERRVRDTMQVRAERVAALTLQDRQWIEDRAVAPVLAAIERTTRGRGAVRPDANLELDLGFDSLARVELVAALEHEFGARVPDEVAQRLFTVRDLVAAVVDHPAAGPGAVSQEWEALLAGDPSREPQLAAVVADHTLVLRLVHAAVRLALTGSRLVIAWRVSGLDQLPLDGPYMICPNHQSYLDPFIVAGHLPFRVVRQMFSVGASEYLQAPAMAWAARQVRLVPVDPDAGLLPALRAGACGLRHGRVLLLFPEGERSIDGTVRRFKPGAAMLAECLRVPIVPVALDGLFELWPRGRPFAWQRLRPWRRHRVVIRIGAPIAPARAAPAGGAPSGGPRYRALNEQLRAAVAALWADAHLDR